MKYQRKTRRAVWMDARDSLSHAPVTTTTPSQPKSRVKVAGRVPKRVLGHPQRIKPHSKMREKDYRKYLKRVREWIKGKRCAVWPTLTATQVHHQRGKIGKLLLDERFWLPVSMQGHQWIDANRDFARDTMAWIDDGRRLKLLCARGDWNRVPVEAFCERPAEDAP